MPISKRWAALPWLLLAFLQPVPAAADTIFLKNGNQIQGEIIEETSQRLTVRFLGGTLQLPRKDVLGVRRESRLQYLLDQGEATLKRDNPEDALAIFKKAREEDPDSEPALKGLLTAQERRAEELEKAGLYGEALSAYRSLLGQAPGHSGAAAAAARIERALKQEAAEEASGLEALEKGQLSEAAGRLRAIHEKFPDRRAAVGPPLALALIRWADQELASGRLVEAENRYLEAASIDPDQAPAMSTQFAFARASRLASLLEHSEFNAVLQEAEEGLRIAPGSDVLAYFAGVALEGLGRTREAREAYMRIVGASPARDPRRSIDRLRKAAEAKIQALAAGREEVDPRRQEVLAGNWREITTEHFLVHHKNATIAEEVAQAAEAAYERLHLELGCKTDWRTRCTITLYPTQGEFQEATGQQAWTGGAHRIIRRAGMLADHQIYSFQTQPRLAAAVIPHEVGHAMLAFRLGYDHEIPLWLNEGFAMHWEPSYVHRYNAGIAAQGLRSRTAIPLAALFNLESYPPNDDAVRVFYAESFSVVDLLLEDQRMSSFIEFARELSASPGSLEKLLERLYRIRGLRALENRWVARLLN